MSPARATETETIHQPIKIGRANRSLHQGLEPDDYCIIRWCWLHTTSAQLGGLNAILLFRRRVCILETWKQTAWGFRPSKRTFANQRMTFRQSIGKASRDTRLAFSLQWLGVCQERLYKCLETLPAYRAVLEVLSTNLSTTLTSTTTWEFRRAAMTHQPPAALLVNGLHKIPRLTICSRNRWPKVSRIHITTHLLAVLQKLMLAVQD